MAKKAAKKTATARKAAAPPKSKSSKTADDSRLRTTAKVVGRMLGRAANRVERLRGTSTTKKKRKTRRDPAKEAERGKTRADWKGQERASSAVERAQQGNLVDERARVRSVTGKSWSNRKPR